LRAWRSSSKGINPIVKWEHDYAENRHFFRIDSIRAGKSKYDIHFAWNGQAIGYDYENGETVTVPAEGAFELLDVIAVNSPVQYAQCTFSEPIDEKQRLSNYFKLTDVDNPNYTVDLNIVRIYTSARLTAGHNLTVEKGLKSTTGKKLSETTTHELYFEQLKPAVKFVGKGVILPSSSGLHLTFQSVNLRGVSVQVYRIYESNILQFLQVNKLDDAYEMSRVGRLIASSYINLAEKKAVNLTTWNTFSVDLAKLIEPEPGAIYRVILDGRDPIGDYEEEDYDDYYEYYRVRQRERQDRMRNVLASDIGMTVKSSGVPAYYDDCEDCNYSDYGGSSSGNGEWYITASNLVSAEPMNGVQLTAYNFVNQPVGKATTDKDGLAVLKCSEAPALIIGQQGKQKTYMRLNNPLSLSAFDVSGTSVQSGVKGFIYGERGVWRPGDTIFLAFILEDKNRTLPANHPVNFSLYDANSQIVEKQVKTSGSNGLYRFTAPTSSEGVTGVWTAYVEVGGQTFSKSLKIETVKPNRLKIYLKLDQIPLLSRSGLSGKMTVNWLHGAVARNLETRINARVTQMRTTFKDYADYSFDDPSKRFYAEEKTLVEGKLNDSGEMKISEDIDVEDAPGMLRVFLSTRVFEEGGDFSIDEFVTTYSPFRSYIGIKPPKGDGYYNRLELNSDAVFEVATVDETGKPVSRRNVDVQIYSVGYSWWWYSMRGEASYSDSRYYTPVYETKINTQNGKGTFSHRFTGNGYYVVKMTDPESGHTTAVPVYASYSYWWGDDDDENGGSSGATMLQLAAGKPSYNVGEEVVISFPAASGAKALVSIEAGSNVKRSFWVDCKSAEGKATFTATADMAPNVYVSISLIQPHAQTENDAPIRLFGVVPLLVEDPLTRLAPVIDMPAELRPEEPFRVKVSEKNGQPMSYTLAIVDDGLLDLTRFKTPSPWDYFYAREALGVRTWDIYNYVIGAYGGKIEQLFAIGGDDELLADGTSAQKAQRFLPVVKYLGPFTVEKGKSNEHKITLPPYIGSVRTMVVATNGRGFGSADKTTPVRKPLMTLATLPRVVGPGEEIFVPVTVFAMEDKIKQVNVEIKANDMFKIEGDTKQSVSFSATGDKTVYFKLKVKDYTGIGKLTATVSGNGEKAEHAIEIDVRNPNPTVYTFAEALVEAGKSWTGEYTLPGMAGTNKAVIEASHIPPVNLGRRLHYLMNYPHGCIEQTTSAVFPQLFLDNVMDLSAVTRKDIETNIKAALNRLRLFITSEGGFSYWPGGSTADEWGTNYAGHFILEAESRGYALPAGMKQEWLRYQTNRAKNWKANNLSDRVSGRTWSSPIQSYRLYTLALAKQPDLSAMNRMMEAGMDSEHPFSGFDKWRLAAAYVLAGKPEVAKTLTAGIEAEADPYSTRFNETFGSSDRDRAMILETLTLMGERAKAFFLVKKLSETLNANRWMSTQETAYCLMAVAKYAGGEKGSKEINIEYTDAGRTQKATCKMPVWQAELNTAGKTGTDKTNFKNMSEMPLFARITASGIPAPGNEKANAHGLEITAKFVNENGAAIDVSRLPQGTDFKAVMTVHNPGAMGTYTNMILSEIFPSGWEIVNTRLNDGSEAAGQSSYDYIDIRDDRVYTYFSISPGSRKTFVVQLSAAYRGKFYLPAFSCEAMYDESIKANTEGKWVEVVE
jgi:uncharacterized protein YfaS (alpha-2-macroglobulin family)